MVDLDRILFFYVIDPIIAVILLYVVYLILRRNPKNHFNQIFATSYISLVLSMVFNIILGNITDPNQMDLVNIIFLIPDYFMFLTMGFILLSVLLLCKPNQMLKRKNQLLFLIVYAGLAAIVFFIPDEDRGLTISSDSVQSPPTLGLPTFTFYMILFTTVSIATLIVSWCITRKLANPKIKRKFVFFIVGVVLLYCMLYGSAIANYLNTAEVRTLNLYISISVLPAIYFVYYGIGKELTQDHI